MAFHKKEIKEEKEWYTVDELCKKYQLSRSFIMSQIREERLKAFHPGKSYRIHKDWVAEWEKENMYNGVA